MKNKRKLTADTAQKLSLGFAVAAFVQADNRGETGVFALIAIAFLVIAYVFTDEE